MQQLWNSFVWWTGQNGGAIQAISAVATVALTAVLAGVTCRYVRLTREPAANSHKQLLLLAYPNLVVQTEVVSDREVRIKIENRGTYPFRLRNASIQSQDEDGKDFTIRFRELDAVVVGAYYDTQGRAFLTTSRLTRNLFNAGRSKNLST